MATVADDEVVEDFDVEQAAGLDQFARHGDVVRGGCGVA